MTEGDNGDLLTNKQYFVSYYEPISDEIDTESRPDIIKGAQSQLEGKYHIRTRPLVKRVYQKNIFLIY